MSSRTKAELLTPALCLDLDRFERNVERVAAACRDKSVAWRPHAKCHKSPAVAHHLIKAGAIGLTCATLREVEIFAEAGIRDLLLAHHVAGQPKCRQLVQLAAHCDLMLCVDSVAAAEQIEAAFARGGHRVRVLIELEIGMRRVGVTEAKQFWELANRIDGLPHLQLAGVMAYEGHLLTLRDRDAKRQAIHEAVGQAVKYAEELRDTGLESPIVSCGGTGSLLETLEVPGVTEVQAGGAIFMDTFYRKACQIESFEAALSVLATVISRPTAERVVIDAGRKAIDQQIHPPHIIAPAGLELEALSAEHGILRRARDAPEVPVGSLVEVAVGYGDLTNHLHAAFVACRGEQVESRWAIVR